MIHTFALYALKTVAVNLVYKSKYSIIHGSITSTIEKSSIKQQPIEKDIKNRHLTT